MVLLTEAKNVDGNNYDGSGWQKKEATYSLRTASLSTSEKNTSISPRFIQNMRIEIPLPPNVVYAGSNYETEKDGIKISGSQNNTYIILECKEYNPNSILNFTMTLDYTKVPTSGGADKYGVNRWHDFFSNTTGIPGRNQTEKSWSFTGEIFGTKQSKIYYNRGVLVLDSISGNYFSSTRLTGNLNYSLKQNEVKVGTTLGGSDFPYSIFNNFYEYAQVGHVRRETYEFDQAIRIKYMEFPSASKREGDLSFTFYTNKGRVETKRRATNSNYEKLYSPDVEEGEYINKIVVEATKSISDSFYFYVDFLDVDINGNKLGYGTVSKMKRSSDIIGFGPMRPLISNVDIATATYVELKAAEPIVTKNINKNNTTINKLISNYLYENISLISVSNTGKESGEIINQDLKDIDVAVSETNVRYTTDTEILPVYQMLTENESTLTIKGYQDSNLPNIKIKYITSLGNKKEMIIDKSKFVLSNGQASIKINFNLPNGELVKGLGMQISDLPKLAEVNLSMDKFQIGDELLPSGRAFSTLPVEKTTNLSYPGHDDKVKGINTIWVSEIYETSYKVPSGETKTKTSNTYDYLLNLYWNLGVGFSDINAEYVNSKDVRPMILQGDKINIELNLSDAAFNPTYAFEIDKSFNYNSETFKGINKEYEIIEEWLPNYFNDKNDVEHYGNGLLRIRFIGRGKNSFNLFPITSILFPDGYAVVETKGDKFSFELQAKNDAVILEKLKLIKKVYRSGKWALENLLDKKLDVKGYITNESGINDEIKDLTSVNVINSVYYATLVADAYDIDGDKDYNNMIISKDIKSSAAETQIVSKQGNTNVQTYLVDKNTGSEIRNAMLYPNQEFDFINSMEVIASADGSDFIGYYHVPKKNHTIKYLDENGIIQDHKSTFNTYLKDFVTTKIEGGEDDYTGIKVYYYISENPEDPASDNHNEMVELDSGVDSSPNYKTQADIEAMVANDPNTSVEEILAKCTMIKLKADTIEKNKKIVSRAPLRIGEKEVSDGSIRKDYFAGIYRYTTNNVRSEKMYTPLTTMTMISYNMSGSIFHDKDADSLMNPLEDRMSNIEVELWKLGKDSNSQDTKLDTAITDENGEYSFSVEQHGDYYVKFKIPEEMKLSEKNKQGGYVDEQSTFDEFLDNTEMYGKSSFTLKDRSIQYLNAGLVDKRNLKVPSNIYISVGETRTLTYQISPDYLMQEEDYKILPTITSDSANDEFFTVEQGKLQLKGVKEGIKKISVSIPDAPLGSGLLTKEITIHVEPASVASVSVPTKADIYALQGKENEIIAPELYIYNYGLNSVDTYIRGIELQNIGKAENLRLVEEKANSLDYKNNEISLRVIPVSKNNPFLSFTKTDITQIEYQNGLLLGTLEKLDAKYEGIFTFDGKYNPEIVSTEPENNGFMMSYRFKRVVP